MIVKFNDIFSLGDREKALNLPISPLCDRASTLVPESQIGFVEFIVAPTYTILGDMFEKVTTQELESSGNSAVGLLREVIDEASESDGTGGRNATGTGKSPRKPKRSSVYALDRVWESNLTHNKLTWQELAKRGKF